MQKLDFRSIDSLLTIWYNEPICTNFGCDG